MNEMYFDRQRSARTKGDPPHEFDDHDQNYRAPFINSNKMERRMKRQNTS